MKKATEIPSSGKLKPAQLGELEERSPLNSVGAKAYLC